VILKRSPSLRARSASISARLTLLARGPDGTGFGISGCLGSSLVGAAVGSSAFTVLEIC
jgi:hypothetical protein